MKLNYERVNLADMLVIVTLSASLFTAIYNSMSELSMSIASGLLGYIGGASKHHVEHREEK